MWLLSYVHRRASQIPKVRRSFSLTFFSLMEHKLRTLYGLPASIPVGQASEMIVKQLKAALVHLLYLPADTEVDGLYDNKMMEAFKVRTMRCDANAIQTFQSQHKIHPTGMMSPATYLALGEKLEQLKSSLEQLGFQCPDDPLKDYEHMAKAIKHFEVSSK